MARIFLRANWQNLAMVSYAVPDALLAPHLPPGCELDRIDGKAFASLVAFEFLNSRVLGVKWPGFVNFLEWNLRFYVQCEERRGVVFIREFITSAVVSAAAKIGYNEPYATAAMSQSISADAMTYSVRWRGKNASIRMALQPKPFMPAPNSRETFFKEQHWGFGRLRSGKRIAYEVQHREWEVLPVSAAHVELDWAAFFGREWSIMQDAEPYNLLFALGSEATISFPAN
ncbi:MAG: hypothetical protein NVS9B15_16280 [Acidobacteriaceae bacterium]